MDNTNTRAPFWQSYGDWVFSGFMLVLCVVLTVLQYRWTGAVARAEMIRLRANRDEQARAFTRAFDAELSASRAQLAPTTENFSKRGMQAAHLARFRQWNATHPRPVFRRLGIATRSADGLQLFLFDQKNDRLTRTNWPAEWAVLEDNLENKMNGGSPPFQDSSGVLQEFPIFTNSMGGRGPGDGNSPNRKGPDRNAPDRNAMDRKGPPDGDAMNRPGGPPPDGESPNRKGPSRGDSRGEHWLIVELDLPYVQNTWLPELATGYLNLEGATSDQLRVRTTAAPQTVIYSSQTKRDDGVKPAISVAFNSMGRGGENSPGPGGRGVWTLEILSPPGSLEAMVQTARMRNLAVAVVINLLMLATAVALVRHTRHARRLAEQQMNFVANVSHELRTPLTVIRGAAHNIQRGLVQERGKIEQYSGLIIQHTEQLTEMIEQLLELAGARKNQAPLARKPVAVANVLKEAIAAAEPDTTAAECSVEFSPPAVLPEVNGDAAALRRVFQNLISNAAKHGGEGHWIGVHATLTNGSAPPMIEVRVADHGPGIPENERAEIFKPFVRGAVASEKQIRGSGLGLSLVKEIVEAHGGAVSLESNSGQGAEFLVRLPVSATTSEA